MIKQTITALQLKGAMKHSGKFLGKAQQTLKYAEAVKPMGLTPEQLASTQEFMAISMALGSRMTRTKYILVGAAIGSAVLYVSLSVSFEDLEESDVE